MARFNQGLEYTGDGFGGFCEKVQTVRVQHTVTTDEATAEFVYVDCPFDVPFADSNFTVDTNLRVVSVASGGLDDALAIVYIAGFSMTPSGIRAYIAVSNAGDVLEVHVTAIHD